MSILWIVVGIFVFFAVAVSTEIIAGKMEGYYVYGFSFLWIHLRRNSLGEPLTKCNGRFNIFPVVTLSKSEIDIEQERRRVKKHMLILGAILLVITTVVVLIFIVPYWGGGVREFMGALWFLAGLILMYFVLADGYRRQLSGPDSDLTATYNKAIQDLRRGASFEQLYLPPEKLRMPKVSDRASIFYLDMCFMKALAKKDIREMSDICRALDRLLSKEVIISSLKTGTSHMEGAYSAVLLFSSYIRPHPVNAEKYYKYIGLYLEEDKDFNSLVIKAFYNLKIRRRPDIAANLTSQAEMSIATADLEKFTRAEIDLYKRLIDELKDLLDMTGGTYFEPRPVISYEE